MWDAIATYFDGTDMSQVYELQHRVTRMWQRGGLIKKYYNDLQGVWCEIDFRCPNSIEYATDIQKHNSLIQEERVYIFLDGLDDRLDNVRSDILQLKPFPTIEQAYAHVRREDTRQAVMTAGAETTTSGAVMAIKGSRFGQPPTLVMGKHHLSSKPKVPFDGGKCTHCGNTKHTRETCFKLHGYPEWWHELQARRKKGNTLPDEGIGRAATVTAEPQLSLIPMADSSTSKATGNCGQSFYSSSHQNESEWIIDSGATDHMTFDPADFSHTTQPQRTCIANANGVAYPVTGAGTVSLSSSLTLSHTLLVPSLSNKLMSVSQVTEELNCVVLIYSNVCFLQDVLSKEIIGRGTKRGGLYYLDDFNHGKANHVHHQLSSKEREIWLWHRRLGHPSFEYLRHLFPNLFLQSKDVNFNCKTCILAKSHRNSYHASLNKSSIPFALIHSDVWGPSPRTTVTGYRWFVIFVDDSTRMTWLYLMKTKEEVFPIFQAFHTMIQNQFSAKIQVLRSDNGGEFVNQRFKAFFQQ